MRGVRELGAFGREDGIKALSQNGNERDGKEEDERRERRGEVGRWGAESGLQ